MLFSNPSDFHCFLCTYAIAAHSHCDHKRLTGARAEVERRELERCEGGGVGARDA